MLNRICKKIIPILLTLSMLLTMLPTTFAAEPSGFVDFPTGWSAEAVSAAVSNGLLRGRTATTIVPQGNLTRAEMATIINRAFGATIAADISKYTDVAPSDWYYNEIAKAVNMQTFNGDGNGLMRPNDPISRQEVFAVIARGLVLESYDYSALSAYSDAGSIAGWAMPYAAVLVQKGYVNGNGNGMICPADNITREEFAQIMHNIIKTYYTSSGTYTTSGFDSSLIRTGGVTLSDVVIDGDLIIGDGVGKGTVNLNNVTIKGRLLCRGGEGAIKLTNTFVGEFVVVKDVNGTVHFDNYRVEAPFTGIVEITPATFLQTQTVLNPSSNGTGGSKTTKYTVTVKGAGEDGEKTVKKNSSFTLPSPDLSEYPAFVGWAIDGNIDQLKEPGTKITVKSDIEVEAVYSYKITHYYQASDLSDTYVIDNTKTQRKTSFAGEVVSAQPLDTQYFIYNEVKSADTKSATITQKGQTELKLYYDRLTAKVTFKFNYEGAPEDVEISDVALGTSLGARMIEDPTRDDYLFARWVIEGTENEFNEGTIITEDIVAVAEWTQQLYTVIFTDVSLSSIKEIEVAKNSRVSETEFPNDQLESIEGYQKNEQISSTLYSGENQYTHQIPFSWYYKDPTSGEFEVFDETTVISEDIVVSDVLTVYQLSPRIQFDINIDVDGKINIEFDWDPSINYEATRKDVYGNAVAGTRAIDTFKDFLWDNLYSEDGQETFVQTYVREYLDQAMLKLVSSGAIDENNNILNQELFVRFSQIIGEEKLEEYIIDNAKDSIKENDELLDAIMDYFEDQANSGDEDAKKEVIVLLEETIIHAVEEDHDVLVMIEDLCLDVLDNPADLKVAMEELTGISVEITEEDLDEIAKVSLVNWAEQLYENDPDFKASVRGMLIDMVIERLSDNTDPEFFNSVVSRTFAGTSFETVVQSDVLGKTTADFIAFLVETHLNSISDADELAVELGYTDFDDLFASNKAEIIDAVNTEIRIDEEFYNSIIASTPLSGYTFEQVVTNNMTVEALLVNYVNNKLATMTDDELAELAGYASKDELIEDAKEVMADEIVEVLLDTNDTAYDDLIEEITGEEASSIDDDDPVEAIKLMLKKIAEDAKGGSYDRFYEITGEDLSGLTDPERQQAIAIFENKIDNDAELENYLDEVTYGKYNAYSELPASVREMVASIIEHRLGGNDADKVFEELGYDDAAIMDEARTYASDLINDKLTNDDSFIIEQIHEYTGITYNNSDANTENDVPEYAIDLIIDIVDSKLKSATSITPELLDELGYADKNELLDAIKPALIQKVSDEIHSDGNTSLKSYIEEFSGITFSEEIPANAIDFIGLYARKVFESMTDDEIMEELENLGYTDDDIKQIMDEIVEDNLDEVLEEMFDYVPSGDLSTMTTREFITDIVVYTFENDVDKRNRIIEHAVEHIVEGGNFDDFRDYAHIAVDYLEKSGQLDAIVDDIIETQYRPTLDKFVDQLINEDKFEILPENAFILSAFKSQVEDYSFEDLLLLVPSQYLDKFFAIYPKEKLETIYNNAYNDLLDQIAQAEAGFALPTPVAAQIDTGLTFDINPVDDVYAPLRDRFVEIISDSRVGKNYYYAENPYLQELIALTAVENIFDTNTGVGTGYAIKDYNEYYLLVLKLVIIGDDAMKWYTNQLSAEQLDEVMLRYEDLAVKYANAAADIAERYATSDELPDRVDNDNVRKIEKAVFDAIEKRFPGLADKMFERYLSSPFNKEYTGEDYAKLRELVRKAFTNVDITTDEVIDNILPKLYELTQKVDQIKDKVIKVNDDCYSITIKENNVTITRKVN